MLVYTILVAGWQARGNVVHADVHEYIYTHAKREKMEKFEVAKHLLYIWLLDTRTRTAEVKRKKTNNNKIWNLSFDLHIWLEIFLGIYFV